MPAGSNYCCSKVLAPYWSNPPFLISARAPECQKLKMVGWTSMAKCKALTGSAVKGLTFLDLFSVYLLALKDAGLLI